MMARGAAVINNGTIIERPDFFQGGEGFPPHGGARVGLETPVVWLLCKGWKL